jgi:hypothetical protein
MSSNSPWPGPQPADFAKLVRAINELCEYVRPLVGKVLTPDEQFELEKLEQDYWDAQAASKLWPPQIPDPNPEDLPSEQHWHPRGLADLYTGPNRDEVKPDDVEWLFDDRLQLPPGWWESMDRLRRTAQRRAVPPVDADAVPAMKSGSTEGEPSVRRRADVHPLQELYDQADRIVSTAPAAYRRESMDRAYWDDFGRTPEARHKAVYAHFRAIGDAALRRISAADLWGRLDTKRADLDRLIHDVAWHQGQAAGTRFPQENDDTSSMESHFQSLAAQTSHAFGFLQQLRPIVVCLPGLGSPADPDVAAIIKELESREASDLVRQEQRERAGELRERRDITNRKLDQLAIRDLFRHSPAGPVIDPPLATWEQVLSLVNEVTRLNAELGDLDAWRSADREALKAEFQRGATDPESAVKAFETGSWLYDRAIAGTLTVETLSAIWATGGAGRAAVGKLFELISKTVLHALPPIVPPEDRLFLGAEPVQKPATAVGPELTPAPEPPAPPKVWGPFRSVKWWCAMLHISDDTFGRRRRDGTYCEHPDTTLRNVSIALDDLTPEERAAVMAAAPGNSPRTSQQ